MPASIAFRASGIPTTLHLLEDPARAGLARSMPLLVRSVRLETFSFRQVLTPVPSSAPSVQASTPSDSMVATTNTCYRTWLPTHGKFRHTERALELFTLSGLSVATSPGALRRWSSQISDKRTNCRVVRFRIEQSVCQTSFRGLLGAEHPTPPKLSTVTRRCKGISLPFSPDLQCKVGVPTVDCRRQIHRVIGTKRV